MRDKPTKFYKKRGHAYECECPKCQHKHEFIVKKKSLPKANCDVEMTVDCMELAGPDVELLIFTGDGDFRYLVEKLVEKGCKVSLFSTRKADKWGDYRFSTRYDPLLKAGTITFIELNNLKFKLKKDTLDEETADGNA